MVRFRPVLPTSLLILALSALILASSAIAAEGTLLHRGTLDTAKLTWETSGRDGNVPSYPAARLVRQEGDPVVPGLSLTLLVPAEASVGTIEVVPLRTSRRPAPGGLAMGIAQESSEGVSVTQHIFKAEGDRFPAAWGSYGGTSFRRGYRLLSLTLFPVRAVRGESGAWDEVEVLEEYEVRLLPNPTTALPTERAERQILVPGERERLERELADVIANPGDLYGYARQDGVPVAAGEKTPHLDGSPISYLIITSEAMVAEFETLAEHRAASGLPAAVRSVEWIEANYRNGADLQETIRGFIREAYERWGVEYVLLGGDTDVIPARYVRSDFYPPGGHTDIPADMYYACLDGNWNADGDALFGEPRLNAEDLVDDADMAPEVFLGRAPVSHPHEAANFVSKVIGYELQPSDASWLDKFMFAAEVLFWDTQGEIALDGASFAEEIHNDIVVPFSDMASTRLYESSHLYPGTYPETREALLDSLDAAQYGMFVQIGHGFFFNMSVGDANITVGDADDLENDGRPFLLYGLNCASCAFDYSCLMERFIKNDTGGSVASIGASRAAFPHTSQDIQVEFFRLLFAADVVRVGELMDRSKLPWLSVSYGSSFTRWTFFNYTLLGDPAMALWRGAPSPTTVSLPASIGGGAQRLVVGVHSDGSPVQDATVTVRGDGVYATASTDAIGSAQLDVVVGSHSDLVVDVQGRDLAWTTRSLPVDLAPAYVGLADMEIIDDGSEGSDGNGNGRVEAGETVALRPTFVNEGGGGAASATATLSTGDSGVTVVTATATVPALSAGSQAQAATSFLVTFDTDLADGLRLDFDVVVDDAGKAISEDRWTMICTAPEEEVVGLQWYDTFFGDGQNDVDDGERIAVRAEIKNFGGGAAGEVSGRLRSDSPNVTVVDSVVTYFALDTGELTQGAGLYSLMVADTAQPYDARLVFTDDRGRTFRHDFQLTAPSIPEGLDTDTTYGPDIIAVSWEPLDEGALRGYHIYRGQAEGGPFERVSTDLVEGIAYYRDEGLEPLTRYYYRVTAVDTSLVESPVSVVIAQSTAPAELNNFPLPVEAESSSHCAVGDVTGDGSLDVVFAADGVYVWRADGSEIFDGDDDSQTHGPITPRDGIYGPMGVALAELDGQPGLEIITQNRATMMLRVLDANTGQDIPGWPQAIVGHWAWATPAVGDVDGDGDLEIVVLDQSGRTYVWHHDGTELRDGDSDPGTNGVFYVRPEAAWAYEFASPALFDLDGDGAAEIIFGTRYGWNYENKLHALKYDGTEAPGFPYTTGFGGNVFSSPTVADLDHDGVWEVIFVHENDELVVLHQDGTHYNGFPFDMVSDNGNTSCPSPAVGDFDDDGQLEIVVVSTSNATTAEILVVDTDPVAGGGTVLSGWPQPLPGKSEGSPVVGDIDGDGWPDIVHGVGGSDEETPDNLYAFRHDGTMIEGFPITLGGPVRPSAVITDLDDDGDVDLVYGGWDLMMHVWDLPYPRDGRAMPWTTFRGHHHRDGVHRRTSVTAVEETPRPAELTLSPAHPNPFNPSTTVRLFVPGSEGGETELSVDIYDVQGRRVRSLHRGLAVSGWHDIVWNGRDDAGRAQASGLYLLRASGGGRTLSAKMALVR